jgi:hypothetical protein
MADEAPLVPKITFDVVNTVMHTLNRKVDGEDSDNGAQLFLMEDLNEGAVLIGCLKDALSPYKFQWQVLDHDTYTNLGRIVVEDGGVAVQLSVCYKMRQKRGDRARGRQNGDKLLVLEVFVGSYYEGNK